MPMFTVTEVHGRGEEWHTKDGKGPFIPYRFKVEGEERLVEWSRKPDSPSPAVGDVLNGDLVANGDFPLRFKKAPSASFGASGGGRSPEEKRRIERMACHKSAVQLTLVAANLGLLNEVKDSTSLFGAVKFLADKLEADLP